MERIALFRFHKRPDVCLDRVRMLHRLNPGLRIFGLCEERVYRRAREMLGGELEDIHYTTGRTSHWKWMHGDLEVRQWFIDRGSRIDFDVLHVIEWDMLFFESLAKAYGMVPKGGMGLTGLVPLKSVESRWSWTSERPYRQRWLKLLSYARERYGYSGEPYACLGGSPCLPRRFLDEYSSIRVPELAHDELNYPLFAQIFGIRLYDDGFFTWFDRDRYRFFNAKGIEVSERDIAVELGRRDGRRVFHPYYGKWRPAQSGG